MLSLISTGTESVKNVIDDAIVGALQSGFDTVATGTVEIVKVALPSALGVFAIFFCIRKAISFFRGVAG